MSKAVGMKLDPSDFSLEPELAEENKNLGFER